MWWGVGAALVANALYSVGFVVEKAGLGFTAVPVGGPAAQAIRVLATSPLWIVGALALAAGFGAQLVVYRALPIAAAQGIFVSGLVLLLLLSSAVLGEGVDGPRTLCAGRGPARAADGGGLGSRGRGRGERRGPVATGAAGLRTGAGGGRLAVRTCREPGGRNGT
ncbi:hypothetical protein SMICM17S_07831 [Streptomyces microflavus]